MNILNNFKRLLAVAVVSFAMVGTVSADWTVYDGSQLPEDAGFSAGSSTMGGTLAITDDADNAGNSLIEISAPDADKNYWKYYLNADNTANGVTMVTRLQALNDTTNVTSFQIYNGTYYTKIYLQKDGKLKVDKDQTYSTELDFTEFHVFRFTMIGADIQAWVDDVQYCTFTTTGTSDNSASIRFGDASDSDAYGAIFDWLMFDETGVYAPGEGSDYPSDLILSPLSSTPVADSWDIYDASETPEVAGFSAGGSNSVGSSIILDDADNAGNKILDMRSAGSEKWYWSSSHPEDYDVDNGFTIVYRMSGITADSSSVGEMEICGGGFRDKVRVQGDNKLNIEKAGITVDMPEGVDVMEYNVYRVTFKRAIDGTDTTGFTQVWVNNTFVAEGTTTTTSTSNKYTIGDSNSSKSYAAYIDWVIRDLTGAYAPGEGSDYPSSLVIAPLTGGEVVIEDFVRFDEATLSIGSAAASLADLEIEANTSWQLFSQDTWITGIAPAEGDSGVSTFTISVEENTDAAPRTATIYALSGEDKMDELTITQEGQAVLISALSATASSAQLKDGVTKEGGFAIDGDYTTSWVPSEGIVNGENQWIKVALEAGSQVVLVKIAEYKNNERLTGFSVDYWNGSEYVETLPLQLSPLQAVANTEVAYTLPSAVTTDTLRFNFYGNTTTTETDPSVAAGWLTISEVSAWGGGSSSTIETEQLVSYQVYPNPSTGTFTIANAEGASVQILSLAGQVVFQADNISINANLNTDLPSGIYLLNVDNMVRKIVVE